MVEGTTKHVVIFLMLAIAILSSGSLVFALNPSFSVSAEPVSYRITPDSYANYTLTVTNYRDTDQVLTAQLTPADATNWIVFPNSFTVQGNSDKEVMIKIYPKSTTGLGVYDLTLKVKDSFDNQELIQLPLHLSVDGYYSTYVPNVALSVDLPSAQDPREPLKISVLTRNRNQLDITNMSIRISSDLFNEEYSMSLGPRKEKTKDFTFDLSPLQEPGNYPIKVDLYYPKVDKVITSFEATLRVGGYSLITPSYETQEEWFLKKEIINLENLGNEEKVKEVSVPAPWPKSMFMYSEPRAERVKVDGVSSLLWNTSLKPTETMQIVVYTNYRVPIILLILIILGTGAYFFFRSPVLILKEAAVVGEDSEGISEIKVRIFLKNRSRRQVHNISVTDKLPGITELIHSNHLGSLKPTRITKTQKKGTLLYWDLDSLESYEERIITYRLKAKLKIVGDITLPKSRVKFDTSSGKERMTLSPVPLFIRR